MPSLRIFLIPVAFIALAATTAAPAFAQYGPPPGPPPPPPQQGGYYQPNSPYYPPPPPPPGVDRRGFTIGGSLGGGSFSTSDTDGNELYSLDGIALEFHLGGMVTQQVGVLFDFWAVGGNVDEYSDVSLFHNIGTVALRWFPHQRFWLQGGLGWSNFSASDSQGNSDTGETGGAFTLGAGFEIFQAPHFAFDVSLRLGAGAYSDGTATQGSLQLGVNWY
jgi:hypothetical protein